ncbi:hypothetical protein [Arthrobacter sp. SPG23]|uniref:hypothetical protein n=1 Tax=Arthrobacter sp. SPG23 TaxID=1610703 RepID=UPI00069722DF|nr:hypothetical protein [Arthrobacter sp. SPG23]
MKRILATAGIAGIALVGVTAPANAGGDKGDHGDKKVSICHATGSESNPYVHITVSENAVNGNGGHASHEGDMIPAPASGCPSGEGHGGGGGGKDDDDDWGHGPDKITICHATGSEKNPYVVITIPEKAWWNGHKDGHNGRADIYPVPAGGCVAEEEKEEEEKPPVVVPPVVTPPEVTPPAVVPPAVTPPAVTPPAQTPAGAGAGAAAAPVGAAAAVVPVVNRGFNAQTAAGSQPGTGMPAWFGGLAALLGATGLIALRQRGRLQDAPGSK